MKKKKGEKTRSTKISLNDCDDETFEKDLKSAESKINELREELEKVNKTFIKSNAQERFLILDCFIGHLLNFARLSPSNITSVLHKYLLTANLTGISTRQDDVKVRSYLG